MIIFIKEKKSR